MSPSLHHHASPNGAAPTAKGAHYAQTLDTARRLALTSSPYPALAKSGAVNLAAVGTGLSTSQQGSAGREEGQGRGGAAGGGGAGATAHGFMDWQELLRKFTKHNPTRTVTAQTAALEHTLRTLLQRSHGASLSPKNPSVSTLLASPPSYSLSAFPLPSTILPTDVPAALIALESLQSLIETNPSGATSEEQNSARIVLAWGRYAVGESEAALRELKVVERSMPGEKCWEGYGVVLRVLAHATEAYALERLAHASAHASASAEVLSAYESAARAYDEACELLSRSSPEGVRDEIELHRIGGEVLFRGSLLARENGSTDTSLSLHALYLRRSSSFLALYPSGSPRATYAFPPHQRATILRSLRSLLSSSSSSHSPADPFAASLLTDLNRAQEKLVREYTTAPKAGEVNAGYLRFLDEVVDSWRKEGAPRSRAAEVVSILHSAFTHTIQSHLLLRHLIHALTLSGRYHEAAQAVRLYRAYGDKTRETDARSVVEEMKRLKRKQKEGKLDATKEREGEQTEGKNMGEDEKTPSQDERSAERAEKQEQQAEDTRRNPSLPVRRSPDDQYFYDLDSDLHFIRTLVFGVRLLLRHSQAVFPKSTVQVARKEAAKQALKWAKRAREVWEGSGEAGVRVAVASIGEDADGEEAKRLEGEVEWAMGVAEGRVAELDANPSHRSSLQTSSLSHLQAASSLVPSSFAIAFSLAQSLLTLPPPLRDTSSALSAAKHAVVLAPRHVQGGIARKQAWHLLALALTAQKDIRGALEVLETAIDEDEEDVAASGSAEALATPMGSEEEERDVRWFFPSDQTDLLTARIQLRLTKAAVLEYLEGAPSALEEQQDLLAYFAREVTLITDEADITHGQKSGEPSLRDGRLTPSSKARDAIKQAGLSADSAAVGAKPHRKTSILGRRRSQKKQQQQQQQAQSDVAPSSAPPSITLGDGPVTSPSPTLSPSPSPGGAPSTAANSISIARAGPVLRPELERNPRARLVLAKVWLACAATFRRMGRLEEARGAVSEAEGLVGWQEGEGEEVADVWSQLALIHLASSADPHPAREAVTKALSFTPSHLPSLILLARVYLTPLPLSSAPPAGAAPPPPPSHLTSSIPPPSNPVAPHLDLQLPLAEALLSTLTSSSGAGESSPEAWFELSRCYKLSGERRDQERECLVKALGLEQTRAVRDVRTAVGSIVWT
ncbi:hypothetical protein JCM11251_003554 [Rhodosporidiobolus azoricus]